MSDFLIPNYDIDYNESKINKCDGVIVYTKNSLSAKVDIKIINETRFLRITFINEFVHSHNTMGITAYYRSPATRILDYISDLELYLNEIEFKKLEIYAGDININLPKSDSCDIDNYLNALNSRGFLSHINKPTRVTSNTESRIDHIFIRI